MRRKSRWFLISIPKDTQATESQFREMFSKTMNDLFGVVSYLYTIKSKFEIKNIIRKSWSLTHLCVYLTHLHTFNFPLNEERNLDILYLLSTARTC